MPDNVWRARLSEKAEQDLIDITRWTARKFGARQAVTYRGIILSALMELRLGPAVPGSKKRDEIGLGLHTLSVARRGRRGSHFLLYRPREGRIIEIVRILHMSMEIERHLPRDAPALDDTGGNPFSD
ncbi:type II toxin-antitoxin system RelE/ParE family toxin [Acidocella facilis]|uniref:type II toxin-antitoxin system RelE/ParE family toxin n=1 Tax=Acidocella facilis TaxID=525 RepID=UPI001F3A8E5C|nr:type II toxin-antitoxin system RelE/ParE family toxin [Acidocella facilis]